MTKYSVIHPYINCCFGFFLFCQTLACVKVMKKHYPSILLNNKVFTPQTHKPSSIEKNPCKATKLLSDSISIQNTKSNVISETCPPVVLLPTNSNSITVATRKEEEEKKYIICNIKQQKCQDSSKLVAALQ